MFEKLKIVELAMYLPLPYTGAFFANFGAHVIKIEHPEGDPLKKLDLKIYQTLNKKKQVKYIDIKDDKNKALLIDILKDADILLNGFKPNFLKRYNLDYEAINNINPSLIYISLYAYEKNTPLENIAGHDLNFVSLSGIIGSSKIALKPFNFQMADMAGALWSIIGSLYMLEKRRKTGKGGKLDLSLFRSSLTFFPFFYFSEEKGEIQNGILYGDYACYGIYKCKDSKYIAVGSLEPKFFKKLFKLLKINFDEDKLYSKREQRYLKNLLKEKFATQTRDYWTDFFKNEDICITPVLEKNETLNLLKHWLKEENIENFLLFPFEDN